MADTSSTRMGRHGAERKDEEHQKELDRLAKFRRSRQLAILHANTIRGAVVHDTQLPTDADLFPVGEVLGASYSNQLLPAPDGWGKTSVVAQLEENCNEKGWAQPIIVRCNALNVRGASFRRVIREILVSIVQSLARPPADAEKAFLADVRAVRDQLGALQRGSDIIRKSISTSREGQSAESREDARETGTSTTRQSQVQRSKDRSFSFRQTTGAAAVAPFVLAVTAATSALSGTRSSRTSTTEQLETSESRRTGTLRSSAHAEGRAEAFQDLDDLKDHLDRIRDEVRSLVLRRQDLLKPRQRVTFFVFDDFDEIPLDCQPHVAEFFRLLAASSDGFVKILGRPHRLNLFARNGSLSAGFRPGRDIHVVDVPNRLLDLSAWEGWLSQKLDWLDEQIPAFQSGAGQKARPAIAPEVLTQLGLLSAGRPGVFFALLARANDLAWEAWETGARKTFEVTTDDVDCALAAVQRVRLPCLLDAVQESRRVSDLLRFLGRSADSGTCFVEICQQELHGDDEFRAATELLADCLAIIPVGVRIVGRGRRRVVFLVDPRSVAVPLLDGEAPAGGSTAPRDLDWTSIGEVIAGRKWDLALERSLVAVASLPALAEGAVAGGAETDALPASGGGRARPPHDDPS
jgi:hypothetical protein